MFCHGFKRGQNCHNMSKTKIATKTTLPFHNKQIQSRNNRENLFRTVEISSVNIWPYVQGPSSAQYENERENMYT